MTTAPTTDSPAIVRYAALALQTRCDAVNRFERDDARAAMLQSIDRIGRQVVTARRFIGQQTRLVVLPEYFMTGFPMGESIEGWADKACVEPDGIEMDRLSGVAQSAGVYLSGNLYELDKHFPGLYFQTCFIMNPSGDVILRYRRMISMYAPTPHDVWDRYLDVYGIDAVFPVADTELGRLACCASEEILFPEITRAHALRGAEVILHSTSEVSSPDLTPKDIAKRARAVENQAYVVSANTAGIFGTDIPDSSADGMSKVVDYKGNVLACAQTGESLVASADIDIAGLRAARHHIGMPAYLSRQRLEAFASTYADFSVYPPNTLLRDGKPFVPERSHFLETHGKTIERMRSQGRL
ncbi:MAG TPA: nitrilase-related carbon-nitrogen hydrolase [Woeseiaceae bacterium]|nr:nitrilase-related carbon-nitrogen hydrolase [Woeseiaceae bacterium]